MLRGEKIIAVTSLSRAKMLHVLQKPYFNNLRQFLRRNKVLLSGTWYIQQTFCLH